MLLSLHQLLATSPETPDALEAEPRTSRVTEIAEVTVADGEIGDLEDVVHLPPSSLADSSLRHPCSS